jgi:hypothetical protein
MLGSRFKISARAMAVCLGFKAISLLRKEEKICFLYGYIRLFVCLCLLIF